MQTVRAQVALANMQEMLSVRTEAEGDLCGLLRAVEDDAGEAGRGVASAQNLPGVLGVPVGVLRRVKGPNDDGVTCV